VRLAAIALLPVPTVSIQRVMPACRSIPSTHPLAYSRYRCQNNSRSLPLHPLHSHDVAILRSRHHRSSAASSLAPSAFSPPLTPPHPSSPLGLLGVRCRCSSAQRQSRSCAARRLLQTLLLRNSSHLRCSRRTRNFPRAARVHPPTNHGHGLSRPCRAAGRGAAAAFSTGSCSYC
jgi:hypothetical protein